MEKSYKMQQKKFKLLGLSTFEIWGNFESDFDIFLICPTQISALAELLRFSILSYFCNKKYLISLKSTKYKKLASKAKCFGVHISKFEILQIT